MARDQEKGRDRIKVDREEPKELKITIHQQSPGQGKESSIWSWHEEFAMQWSETFITTKVKKNPKK